MGGIGARVCGGLGSLIGFGGGGCAAIDDGRGCGTVVVGRDAVQIDDAGCCGPVTFCPSLGSGFGGDQGPLLPEGLPATVAMPASGFG